MFKAIIDKYDPVATYFIVWVPVYTPFLCFLSREYPLAIVGELVWWWWILSAFEILAGYSNLGCRLFSFITLSKSCHSLLAWSVSIERSTVILMGIPLCVICCFPLGAFNICSLCLIFVNLINMCLGVFFALGLSYLGLSGFLWLGWLFPSPF